MDIFRIHPAIGIARVGNSDEYVVAPETMAGSPDSGNPNLTGGLPIRAGTLGSRSTVVTCEMPPER
jgi:hypothetical protein